MNNGSEIRIGGKLLAESLTGFETPQYFAIEDQLKQLIYEAVKHNCSDIILQPYQPALMLKSNRLLALTNRELNDSEITAFIPWLAGRATAIQDISEGIPVDSRYEIFDRSGAKDVRGNKMRFAFRVNISGIFARGGNSYQIVMRTIPSDPPTLDYIRMDPEFVRRYCTPDNGIVLICGSTGSGKSTTFAGIMRFILENDTNIQGNIVTSEEPIEYTYDNIVSRHSVIAQSAVPINFKTFGKANEAAMRRHPFLAMIGELRDDNTVRAAVELSLTGHPVFATVHSSTVATVIKRLVSRFPVVQQASAIADLLATVRTIVAQRLMPRADEHGLIVAREWLHFTPEIARQLGALQDLDRLVPAIQDMVQVHGHSFKKEGLRLYKEGMVTEAVRDKLMQEDAV